MIELHGKGEYEIVRWKQLFLQSFYWWAILTMLLNICSSSDDAVRSYDVQYRTCSQQPRTHDGRFRKVYTCKNIIKSYDAVVTKILQPASFFSTVFVFLFFCGGKKKNGEKMKKELGPVILMESRWFSWTSVCAVVHTPGTASRVFFKVPQVRILYSTHWLISA